MMDFKYTSDIPALFLCPLRDSYNVELDANVVSTDTMSKIPRQRQETVGEVHNGSVTYRCTPEQYTYFRSFWRKNKARPVMLKLSVDALRMEWYKCYIVNKTIQLSHTGLTVVDVPLQIKIVGKMPNTELDNAIIELYKKTEGQISAFFNHLEHLVNYDLPHGTPDILALIDNV